MIRVLFYGRVADRMGAELSLDLPPDGAAVGDIRARLAAGDGPGSPLLDPGVRAALDHETVGDAAVARPGQELVFFSIVSGG